MPNDNQLPDDECFYLGATVRAPNGFLCVVTEVSKPSPRTVAIRPVKDGTMPGKYAWWAPGEGLVLVEKAYSRRTPSAPPIPESPKAEVIQLLQDVEDEIGKVVFAFMGDGTERADRIRAMRAKVELALNNLGAGSLSAIRKFSPTAVCTHGYNRIICAQCNAPRPSAPERGREA